ncbi:S4 domain-containing protein YaaA [Scopulibacillus cellulosilyticus]|uniref:S4 domain-containing protein YaaA n=1 Tax=Scopulibacillus cellulosilyticus TaxID=2665665 RepID=A0ABW2Q0C2_9BACL
MQQVKINSDQDYMTLGQLLKYIGVISTGGQAKWFLSEHSVMVNQELENRRGRKLYDGDQVEIEHHGEFIVEK